MILWMIAALCAFFVKGLCGFANTLVFTTLLSFGTSNVNISPVEVVLGYPTNAILAWKERRSIEWKVCAPLAALVILGAVPGAFFLKSAGSGIIKIVFGIVIIVVGLEMLLRKSGQDKVQSRFWLILVGVLSGILCGLYGVGALLGAYVGRFAKDSHAFKANLCVVFLVENTFRIILYMAWSIITVESLKQTLIIFPAALLGLGLGMGSSRILDENMVKKFVIVMLILSGIALIWGSV